MVPATSSFLPVRPFASCLSTRAELSRALSSSRQSDEIPFFIRILEGLTGRGKRRSEEQPSPPARPSKRQRGDSSASSSSTLTSTDRRGLRPSGHSRRVSAARVRGQGIRFTDPITAFDFGGPVTFSAPSAAPVRLADTSGLHSRVHDNETSRRDMFGSEIDYLRASLRVDFDYDGIVDMHGGQTTGSSYSLPGHVVVTMPALPMFLVGKVREIRTFELMAEGKSEYFDVEGRYFVMRLFQATTDIKIGSSLLVPSHDPQNPARRDIRLAVPFDVRIPGWLPPTHLSTMTNTSYGVIVKALIGWVAPPLSNLAAPPKRNHLLNHSLGGLATSKATSEYTEFCLRRHRIPTAMTGHVIPIRDQHYTLNIDRRNGPPLEVIITLPDILDVNGDERSFKIALRFKGLARPDEAEDMQRYQPDSTRVGEEAVVTAGEEVCTTASVCSTSRPKIPSGKEKDGIMTRILELGMEIEEVERFTSDCNPQFTASYPISEDQPDAATGSHLLISPPAPYPRPPIALCPSHCHYRATVRSRRLLADDGSQRNFWFQDKGLELGEKWRKVNVVLPMPELGTDVNASRPQGDLDAPYLRVRHFLKIRMVCKNPEPLAQAEEVTFSVPIKCGTSVETFPGVSSQNTAPPAYIQVFHENGDLRDCDPLPLYSSSPRPKLPTLSPTVPKYNTLFPDGPPMALTTGYPLSRSNSSTTPHIEGSANFRSSSPTGLTGLDETMSSSDEGGVASEPRLPIPKRRSRVLGMRGSAGPS